MGSCSPSVNRRETAPSCQPFPTTGTLAAQSNRSFRALREAIPTDLLERPVYSYVVTSVKMADGELHQTGCAPNFQGGIITLCTCKHKDRASPPPVGRRGPSADDPWQGVWVAGLSSSTQARPRRLFYLMLVRETCGSHAAAWTALRAPLAKSGHRDVFGDIYEPNEVPTSRPWNASSYRPYLTGHAHDEKGRAYDIEASFHNRHPALLVGTPGHSYLWSRPILGLRPDADSDWASAHHRFYARLGDFFALCE